MSAVTDKAERKEKKKERGRDRRAPAAPSTPTTHTALLPTMQAFASRLLNAGESDEEASTRYADTSTQPSLLDRARTAAGLQPTRREEVVDAVCPSLTLTQRVYGFGICFGVGCLISLGSMMFFHQLLAGRPAPFAVNCARTRGVALEPHTVALACISHDVMACRRVVQTPLATCSS